MIHRRCEQAPSVSNPERGWKLTKPVGLVELRWASLRKDVATVSVR